MSLRAADDGHDRVHVVVRSKSRRVSLIAEALPEIRNQGFDPATWARTDARNARNEAGLIGLVSTR